MPRRYLPNPPTEGCRVDILDPQLIWSSGIVTSVRRLTSSTIVEVRYEGWPPAWNEELPLTSKRLAPIYTYTARLRCLVRLFQRSNKKSSQKGRNANHIWNLWPCTVNLRMADKENNKALLDLTVERKVFIEPCRPDLLPNYTLKGWGNGGLWIEIERVRLWKSSDELSDKAGVPLEFLRDFEIAHQSLTNDSSIPGNLGDDVFERGTLVREKYRGVSKTGKGNILVNLKGWRDTLVDLISLDKTYKQKKTTSSKDSKGGSTTDSLSSASTSEGKQRALETTHGRNDGNSGNASIEGTKRSLRSRPSRNSDFRMYDDFSLSSASTSDGKQRASETAPRRSEGTRRSLRSRPSRNSDILMSDDYLAEGTAGFEMRATRSTMSKLRGHGINPEGTIADEKPLEPGGAMLRNAITVDGSNYSDYAITKSSTTGEWLASFDVRGNTVQVGKFQTQTQAKEAIDNARAGLKSAGERGGNVMLPLPKTTTAKELEDAKEKDVTAITVEKAVAVAYRNGDLGDTGFSMHNWTLEVIKDKDKIREKDKLKLQKEFLEMKKRRKEDKNTPLTSNRKKSRIER